MAKTADIQIVADVLDQFEDELLLIEKFQIAPIPPIGLDAVVAERVGVFVARGTDKGQSSFDVGDQRAQQPPAFEFMGRYLPHRRGGARAVLVAP